MMVWPGSSVGRPELCFCTCDTETPLVHTCSHLCKNEWISQPTTLVVCIAFMSIGLHSGSGGLGFIPFTNQAQPLVYIYYSPLHE